MKITKFWEANFIKLEFVLAIILSATFIAWSEYINRRVFLFSITADSREVLYGTLASLFGSLLGFNITAVSIVLGYAANEKLALVRNGKHYQDLWNVFKSAIRVLALTTILALLGLFIDKGNQPFLILIYFNVYAIILSSLRLSRCVWVLEKIIAIVTKES